MLNQIEAEKRADAIDALRRQCDQCKLGAKPIGPKSGCEVRKKLVIDQSDVAWKNKHLFFDDKGMCKMAQPKKAGVL